jgi:two-component system, NarL family, sensor kinase
MDQQEAKIFTSLLIAAIVLAIIIGYFIFSIISHHRRNLKLHKEKIQAEIVALENERKRMASDLHDELGPVLSAVKMQINSVDTSEEDAELIDKASGHIDTMLQRIREISNNLMPTVLVRKGFVVALKEFSDNINQTGKINIVYNPPVSSISMGDNKEIHLYRIVQEIIHNTIKHAQATEVKVQVQLVNDWLHLEVADNGRGFNQAEVVKTSSGHGLSNILSRVEILRGHMYVDTKPGKGVKYNIEIPAHG